MLRTFPTYAGTKHLHPHGLSNGNDVQIGAFKLRHCAACRRLLRTFSAGSQEERESHMPCLDTSEHHPKMRGKKLAYHGRNRYLLQLQSAAEGNKAWGNPGLGPHACKTRWHDGGLVGEQGYEADATDFHLSGRRIPMVCTSLIAHHEKWKKSNEEEGSFRLDGLTRGHSPLTFGVLPRCHVGSPDWPCPEAYMYVTLSTACAFERYHTPKLPARSCFCLGSRVLDWWNTHLQDSHYQFNV